MELRVLNYFLTVAREESITGAANALHLSQPTLSRQLKDMEEELGKPLFLRGSRKIELTEEGYLLRKRAEEILTLVAKTESEISSSDDVSGTVSIIAGETEGVRHLARAMHSMRRKYPEVQFQITSGDTQDTKECLDKGLVDFGLTFGEFDPARYNSFPIPHQDFWGLLMHPDSPLASKKEIQSKDLLEIPLIISRGLLSDPHPTEWAGASLNELHIVATYSLLYNASILVEEQIGYALCLNGIINTRERSLCFRPLADTQPAAIHLVWKKYQYFSKASEKFLQEVCQSSTA